MPNTKLPCCQLYPSCPPPMKPVFEIEALENGMKLLPSRKLASLFTSVFCHAAPACAPIYQPAQLAGGGTYCGALSGMSAACAPGAAAAAAAKPADVAIRKPFFRIGGHSIVFSMDARVHQSGDALAG